jgi:hypothetical protein
LTALKWREHDRPVTANRGQRMGHPREGENMAERAPFLNTAYSAYHHRGRPAEDEELTHTLPGSEGFTDDFKELGEWDWMETPVGMVYIDTRRQGDRVWVRVADFILPNIHQFPPNADPMALRNSINRPMATASKRGCGVAEPRFRKRECSGAILEVTGSMAPQRDWRSARTAEASS